MQGFWLLLRLVDGISSTLQALLRLRSLIYELEGNSLALSVQAARLISVVMSWFPDFWPFSALTLERSWSRYTYEDAFGVFFWKPPSPPPLSLSLLPSWKPLLSTWLCLCSWKTPQDYFTPPQLPRSRSMLETDFLDVESPPCSQQEGACRSILFGNEI